MVEKQKQVAKFIVSHVRVTSAPNKTNLRDQVIAWGGSALVTLGALGSSLLKFISSIFDAIADYVLPYLQQVPRQDRPAWLAVLTFILMGVIVLNKRRVSGSYTPPPPFPPMDPAAVPPPPPGAAVDTSKTAF